MVKARFVKDGDTKVLLLAVGLGHLQEGINLADCGDVVWDEGLDLRVQFDLLWLVPLDVLEHLLELFRNGQVGVLVGVVGAWDFLLVVVVFFFITLCCTHLLAVLLRLLYFLLLCNLRLDVHINVHLVFLLIRVDFLRVVHIYRQVEGLVLHLGSLDVTGDLRASDLRGCSDVGLHWLAHGVSGGSRHIISLFLTVELVANFERFSSLLGEAVIIAIHFLFKFKLLIYSLTELPLYKLKRISPIGVLAAAFV